MMMRLLAVMLTGALLAGPVRADDDATTQPEDLAAVVEAVRLSLVDVEFTLRTHNGRTPTAAGRHGGWSSRTDLEAVIDEQRPYLEPGFVLSTTEVLMPDPMIHPRFIERIAVRVGDKLIDAKPAAYGLADSAVMLKLAEPVDEARVLRFDVAADGPLFAVTYSPGRAHFATGVQRLPTSLSVTHGGRVYRPAVGESLITAADGTPVGMCMNGWLPPDDTWRGSPTGWPMISAADLAAAQKRLEAAFARSVGRVGLSFRSPKKGGDAFARYDQPDDETPTEMNTLGGVIDDGRLLVLAKLEPKTTARLERIRFFGGGEGVAAEFAGTLTDYGAFVATVDAGAEAAIARSEAPITDWWGRLLLSIEVHQQGEQITTYVGHRRISGYEIGLGGRRFPSMSGEEGLVLFDTDGRLVALPIARRRKNEPSEPWRRRDEPILTPVAHVAALLDDLAAHVDAGNVPLSAEQEARLAWLGVELQPLDAELARINKVSHLTRDGEFGGLVSYVYADSPAAEAGVRTGDVLIRLHVAELPMPIEVTSAERRWGGDQPFPWEHWDQLPEDYFDCPPRPWPPAESELNRVLTNLGFGTTVAAEFARDGKPFRETFTITQGPRHYDMAPQFDCDSLGMTVRDMTYEVRRYFLRRPDDPGVIIATLEPGSRAAVAGVKPLEIITHVNDRPVSTAAEFEHLVAAGGELRLDVLRMTKSRVVRIRPAEPGKITATQPAAAAEE